MFFPVESMSPKKEALAFAESRKIQFDEFQQTCQHKPKRDVGKPFKTTCIYVNLNEMSVSYSTNL